MGCLSIHDGAIELRHDLVVPFRDELGFLAGTDAVSPIGIGGANADSMTAARSAGSVAPKWIPLRDRYNAATLPEPEDDDRQASRTPSIIVSG